jgi:hypothetical protein
VNDRPAKKWLTFFFTTHCMALKPSKGFSYHKRFFPCLMVVFYILERLS